MRLLPILLFLTWLPAHLFSQEDSAVYVKRYTSVWRAVNAGYRITTFMPGEFQRFYRETYGLTFGDRLNSVVLELDGPDNYLQDIYLSGQYYLPLQVNSADTTTANLQGFSFETQLFYGINLLFRQKELDLPVYPYWQIGSLYLKQDNLKGHNFFLNFGVRTKLRLLMFGRLCISISGDISWDVTKAHWKYDHEIQPAIPSFKKNAYSIQFNFGWRYSKRQSNWMRLYQ